MVNHFFSPLNLGCCGTWKFDDTCCVIRILCYFHVFQRGVFGVKAEALVRFHCSCAFYLLRKQSQSVSRQALNSLCIQFMLLTSIIQRGKGLLECHCFSLDQSIEPKLMDGRQVLYSWAASSAIIIWDSLTELFWLIQTCDPLTSHRNRNYRHMQYLWLIFFRVYLLYTRIQY